MASIDVRRRLDGSVVYRVMFREAGVQRSRTFEDHHEAEAFAHGLPSARGRADDGIIDPVVVARLLDGTLDPKTATRRERAAADEVRARGVRA